MGRHRKSAERAALDLAVEVRVQTYVDTLRQTFQEILEAGQKYLSERRALSVLLGDKDVRFLLHSKDEGEGSDGYDKHKCNG